MKVNREQLYNFFVYGNVEGNENEEQVKWYFTQEDAYRAYERKNGGLLYTCDSVKGKGKKKFILFSLNNFYSFINRLNPKFRCFYEMLKDKDKNEKLDMPVSYCHLYADVEIYFDTNPSCNTIEQYEEIKHVYLEEFEDYICDKLKITKDSIRRVELDASQSDKKLSKHYIWRIDGIMFNSNNDVGAFVRNFERHIIETYGDPKKDDNIFYFWRQKTYGNDPWKGKTFWFDMGVYTKNRQFRTFGSTKYGQQRPLTMENQQRDDLGYMIMTLEDFVETSVLCPDHTGSEFINILQVLEHDGSVAISTSNLFVHRQQDVNPSYEFSNNNNAMDQEQHIDHDEDEEYQILTSRKVHRTDGDYFDYYNLLKSSGIEWEIPKRKKLEEIDFTLYKKDNVLPKFIFELGEELFDFLKDHIRKQMEKYKIKLHQVPDYSICSKNFIRFNPKFKTFSFQTKSHYCPIRQKEQEQIAYNKLSEGKIVNMPNINMFHSNNNSIMILDLYQMKIRFVCHGCKYKGGNVFKKSDYIDLPFELKEKYKEKVTNLLNAIKNVNKVNIQMLFKSINFNQ